MSQEFSKKFNELCKAQGKQEQEAAWRNLFQTEGVELTSEDVKFLTKETK